MKILEFNKKLDILEVSRNQIKDRLDIQNQKLSNILQKIRIIRKYGEFNPFDFNDIDQHADEFILNEFSDLAENDKTKYDRTPVFDVIVDSQRDNLPFILNVEFLINDGQSFQVKRFYKDSDQLTKSIEKKIDKKHHTLEVSFSGDRINYTKNFNEIKRSNYRKGCDASNNILEYEGHLCYIHTGNACFRKSSEYIYKGDFSIEYKDFIKD